ncbi:YadA C-terminal domain-containing protein [Vibrio gigantis]|uniref:YadA C-terminal domain-containing protein n=1 Tax=Vibrio gigantis TaxID=296199 RepID=UPI002FC8EAA8
MKFVKTLLAISITSSVVISTGVMADNENLPIETPIRDAIVENIQDKIVDNKPVVSPPASHDPIIDAERPDFGPEMGSGIGSIEDGKIAGHTIVKGENGNRLDIVESETGTLININGGSDGTLTVVDGEIKDLDSKTIGNVQRLDNGDLAIRGEGGFEFVAGNRDGDLHGSVANKPEFEQGPIEPEDKPKPELPEWSPEDVIFTAKEAVDQARDQYQQDQNRQTIREAAQDVRISSNTNRIDNLEAEMRNMGDKMLELDDRMDGVVASSHAIMNARPALNSVGDFGVGVGMGFAGSKEAIALGGAYAFNENWSASASLNYETSGNFSDSQVSGGAGVQYTFK